MSTILIVPGLGNSGPQHWQSWFEQKLEGCVRVEQEDWDEPYLPRWAGAVRHELARANGPVWIVAHSFGCLAAVHAATEYRDRIAGAMLVAPADPDKFNVSALLPEGPLGFPSVVVASTNDPWVRMLKAGFLAEQWESRLINIGAKGHINAESGFGPWIDGLEIFSALRAANAGLPLGRFEGRAKHLPRPGAASRQGRSEV
ncbi:alpha/beta hydrolase [Uliginosibacterium sediminicola]|uniref:Alpha/beta hydrolase n=1 Tax=Uliginosibacterium sediminicola TaxID=2024550 RepID=A0ABU9Z1G6_9RHOO